MERKEVIDSEQLLDATYDYMKKMMKTMGVKGLKKKALGNLTNVITARDILHETGWPLYSIHTKITENMGKKNVEERVIELK